MSDAAGKPRLEKLPAPAYWARWRVLVDGGTVGYVERRGGGAAWVALDGESRLVATMCRDRAAAVAAIRATCQRDAV